MCRAQNIEHRQDTRFGLTGLNGLNDLNNAFSGGFYESR